MSSEAPQEPSQPTPESWRARLPSVSRNVALALVALAVGGAALGLSVANRLADDDGGSVAYVSNVDVGRWSERFGPPPGYKPGFARPPSRFGRGSFGKGSWDRDVRGKRGERFPTRKDAGALAGTVIAIGEVTGVSRGTISVFTILGNDVDIALPRADQADGVVVGGWAIVMAERTTDGLVARSVRPMSVPDAFRDRAWSRSAVAS
ncbi:MAG: hypothetical protein OXF96_07725 [Chloroflexi bacterium]|nr:hypothetical protein [Chloroflexota bacterium]